MRSRWYKVNGRMEGKKFELLTATHEYRMIDTLAGSSTIHLSELSGFSLTEAILSYGDLNNSMEPNESLSLFN